MIKPGSCFKKNDQIICRQIGSEMVLVDAYRRVVIRLNPVALRIWELIDGLRYVSVIVDMIADEFEAERSIVERDTMEFIKDLYKREMVF